MARLIVRCLFVLAIIFISFQSLALENPLKEQEQQELEAKLAKEATEPKSKVEIKEKQEIRQEKCFILNKIIIDSEPRIALNAKEQVKIAKNYIGCCMGAKDFRNIIDEINQYLFSKGLITSRAFLPKQDVSKGNLTIKVQPGIIEEIKGSSAIGLPFQEGELLNLFSLEQAAEDYQSKVTLEPGEKDGGTKVIITKDLKPYSASLSIDNHNNKKKRISFSSKANNLLGLNHRLALAGDASTFDNIGYSVRLPWQWWSLEYSISQSNQKQQIISLLGKKNYYYKQTNNQNIALSKVVFRNSRHILTPKISYGIFNGTQKYKIGASVHKYKQRSIRAISFGSSHLYKKDKFSASSKIILTKGLKINGAYKDRKKDFYKAQFLKLEGSFLSYKVIKQNLAYQLNINGQISNQALYDSQKFDFGNSVHLKSSFNADSALKIRQQLNYYQQNITKYLYLDLGHGHNKKDKLRFISAAGIGLTLNYRKMDFNLDLQHLIKTPYFTKKPISQITFKVGYKLL